jgi:SagB-type dehydrogenase family enzyme
VRNFGDAPVSLEAIGQILWAAQGITEPPDHRPAPSAGACYPLRLHAVTRDAIYTYVPERHSLIQVKAGDFRRALYRASYEQGWLLAAPLTVVIAAVYTRTAARYGPDRGTRYVHIEAGHVAQNVLLQATAQGLCCVPMGAFDDWRVKEALSLPDEEMPLCLVPIGAPG